MPPRFQYPQFSTADDTATRVRMESAMDSFWESFLEVAPQIADTFVGKAEFPLVEWMNEHLEKIAEGIMWEFGPPVHKDGHRLVLTSEANLRVRPVVDVLVSRAPEMPGWEVFGWRLAEPPRMTLMAVEQRTGISMEGATFTLRGDENGLVQISIEAPGFVGAPDDACHAACVIACESACGGELLNYWVGYIEAKVPPRPGLLGKLFGTGPAPTGRSIKELKAALDAHVRDWRASLPTQSYCVGVDDRGWAGISNQPQPRPDYPEQSDAIAISTCVPELFIQCRSSEAIPERLLANGDCLAYVKLDGSQRPAGEETQWREQFADALHGALQATGFGCVVGGATGIAYSYVHLVLRDVEKGVAMSRDLLRELDAPKRSWLLFEDPRLVDEWVPVWDESGPPPMA